MLPPSSPSTRAKTRASILPSRRKDSKYTLRIVPASPAKPKAPSVTSASKASEGLAQASPSKRKLDSKDKEKEKDKKPKEVKPRPPHKNKVYFRAGLWSADPLYPPSRGLPPSPSRALILPPPPPSPMRKSTLSRVPHRYLSQFPPLPIHWGLGMMEAGKEFCLPYDVLYDWQEGGLEGKKVPGKYLRLRRNIFTDRKAFYNPEVLAICSCTPESRCGDACLNRAMNYLCGKQCPAGDKCTNQSLAAREQKEYKVVWTGNRGFGIQAAEEIQQGDFIMDYRGEIISMNTFYARIRSVYSGRKDFYALSYDGDEVIDAGLKGNDARFINHSCAPNIEVRKYATIGMGSEEFEVGFWAMRDIAVGEELFYNYNFDSFTTIRRPPTHPDFAGEDPIEKRQKCYCGAATCSGLIGKKGPDLGSAEEGDGGKLRGKKLKGKQTKKSALRQIRDKMKKARKSALVTTKVMTATGSPAKRQAETKTTSALDIDIPAKASPAKVKPALKRLATVASDKRKKALAAGTAELIIAPNPKKQQKKVDKLLVGVGNARKEKVAAVVKEKKRMSRLSNVSLVPVEVEESVVIVRGIKRKAKQVDGQGDVFTTATLDDAEGFATLSRKRKGKGKEVISEPIPKARKTVTSSRVPKPSVRVGAGPKASTSVDHLDLPLHASSSVDSLLLPSAGSAPTLSSMASVDASSPAPPLIKNGKGKGKAGPEWAPDLPLDTVVPSPTSAENASRSNRVLTETAIDPSRRRPMEGLLSKTDEELEEERRKRRKGPKWFEEQKELQLHLRSALGAGSDMAPGSASTSSLRANAPSASRPTPAKGLTLEQAKGALLAAMAPTSIEIRSVFMPDQSNTPYIQRSMADLIAASALPDHAPGDPASMFGDPGRRQLGPPGDVVADHGDMQAVVMDYPGESSAGDGYHLMSQGPVGGYVSFSGHGTGLHDAHVFDHEGDYMDIEDPERGLGGPSHGHGETTADNYLHAAHTALNQGHSNLLLDKSGRSSAHQKAEEKAARAAAKAEKAARREQEEQGKKRRKKWILPLDDEQIEVERRKKKKGQAWLAAMKEAAAAKRAAAGIAMLSGAGDIATPVGSDRSEPPPQHNTNLTLSEAVEEDTTQMMEEVVEEDAAELSSLSEMTELEEMEMNEDKPILFREDSMGNQVPTKPKRNRKPRPPRRFKTTLTRMRPKLEAALVEVSPAEEAMALERERKRRKKGTVWLDAMKALAKAQREAREAVAAGLPPPEFELPPTSLVPSGKRRTKKAMAAAAAGSSTGHNAQAGRSGGRAGAPNSQSPAPEGAALPGLSTMPEIPAYMFPPNHGRTQDEDDIEHAAVIDQSIFEPLLANAAASFNAQQEEQERHLAEDHGDSTTLAGAQFQSFMPEFQGEDGSAAGQYALSSFRFDNDGNFPVEHFAAAAAAAAAGPSSSGLANDEEHYSGNLGMPSFPDLQLQGDAAVYALPTFDAYGRAESPSHGSAASGIPGLSGLSPTGNMDGQGDTSQMAEREKRKRGPPVKKIVGHLEAPFTDEDWENERRKRKKGSNWVQQTKAAAEVERIAAATKGPGGSSSRSKGKRPATSQDGEMGMDYSEGAEHVGEILPYPQQHEEQEDFLISHGTTLAGASGGQDFDVAAFGLRAQDRQELGLEQARDQGHRREDGQGDDGDAGEDDRMYHAAIFEALGDASGRGHL